MENALNGEKNEVIYATNINVPNLPVVKIICVQATTTDSSMQVCQQTVQ